MPGIFDEEEKKKREKGAGEFPGTVAGDIMRPAKPTGEPFAVARHEPTTPEEREAFRAGKTIPGFETTAERFRAAAQEPTVGARIGGGLRAVMGAPGAAISEAVTPSIEETKKGVEAVRGFAGEVARGMAGVPEVKEDVQRPQAAPAVTGRPGTIRLPSGEVISTEGRSREEVLRAVRGQGEDVGRPAGQEFAFTTPSGEKVTGRGATREEALQSLREEAGPTAGRMVTYGGFTPQVRQPEEDVYRPERLSDIGQPRTMGDIQRYRREVAAKKFDIEQEAAAERQKAGIEQAAAEREQRAAVEEREAGLEERGMELRETQAEREAERLKAESEAKQAQQAQLAEAQQAFEAAGTVDEKIAAANRIRMLRGQAPEVKAPEPGEKPMSEAEASKASQSAYKTFVEAGGDPAEFHQSFFSSDPTAWRRVYGGMNPQQVKNYETFVQLTPEQKEAQARKFNMSADEYMKELDKQYKAAREG